ncbi:MAG: hypothetical protein Q7T30_03820, partial [Planctomycetota bacterium]|nr:hypothetical protein [Planctomycetota bacterium]
MEPVEEGARALEVVAGAEPPGEVAFPIGGGPAVGGVAELGDVVDLMFLGDGLVDEVEGVADD